MGSRIVQSPDPGPHRCMIWVQETPLPDDHYLRSIGATHTLELVHMNDGPGTVRECDECGARWVAVRTVAVRSGQQRVGVGWKRLRERRRRWWHRAE